MGVRRVIKFCKYLPEYKWDPIVLTVKNKRGIQHKDGTIEDLEKRGVSIYRSGSADPYRLCQILKGCIPGKGTNKERQTSQAGKKTKRISRFLREWLFIPDDKCLWIPFAVAKGLRIIKKEKPELIMTTSYPSSAHVVGFILKKLTGLPLVTDFRDGWLQNPVFYRCPTPLHKAIQSFLEKRVAENADLIIGVTDPITDYFVQLTYAGEKCMTITNGYDPEDFQNQEPLRSEPPTKFVVLYSGTLFAPRSPEYLLRALKEIIDAKPHLKSQIRLAFLSVLDQEDLKLIEDLKLGEIVHCLGFVSYSECIGYQKGADVLALMISPQENAEIMMTQKVFEYLGSNRPILAMVPPGPCHNLLTSLGSGKTVLYDDIPAIKGAIIDFVSAWCKHRLTGAPPEKISQFTRKKLTEQLAFALYRLQRGRMKNDKGGTP